MKFAILYHGDGRFSPASPADIPKIAKLKPGEVHSIRTQHHRNGKHHAKLFVLLDVAFQSQEMFDNKEHFRAYVTIGAGHCDTIINHEGKVNYIPKSISYEALDQLDFEEFYASVHQFLLDKVLPGVDEGELDRTLDELLRFM